MHTCADKTRKARWCAAAVDPDWTLDIHTCTHAQIKQEKLDGVLQPWIQQGLLTYTDHSLGAERYSKGGVEFRVQQIPGYTDAIQRWFMFVCLCMYVCMHASKYNMCVCM